ncbi:MAG: hypothetical protein QW176_08150, partial [Candidatus Bathyarchaeia archaeon]
MKVLVKGLLIQHLKYMDEGLKQIAYMEDINWGGSKMGYTLDGSESIPEPELLGSLPPEYIEDLSSSIEEILRSRSEELVVFLEDDSTGVQKSHNVYLVTQLTRKAIHSAVNAARRAGHRLIFVLTNSRVL